MPQIGAVITRWTQTRLKGYGVSMYKYARRRYCVTRAKANLDYRNFEVPFNPLLMDRLFSTDDSVSAIASKLVRPMNGNGKKKLTKEIMEVIFKKLTPRQRIVVSWYFWGDMTQKQIAGHLGISPSTVSKHLDRAIAKMRKSLGLLV